jgi:hypothetical protein
MTTSTRSRRTLGLIAVVAALTFAGELTGTGPLLLGGGDAHPVIGRPLTPMSYAGVARRTTRRTVYATGAAAATSAAVVATAPVVPTASVVTALPGGCGQVSNGGGVYYQCGAARYQPYYYGSTLVYRPL